MTTHDEFENLCEDVEGEGWIVHLTRQRSGWHCRLEPCRSWISWRSFGAPGATAMEAVYAALARRDEAIPELRT